MGSPGAGRPISRYEEPRSVTGLHHGLAADAPPRPRYRRYTAMERREENRNNENRRDENRREENRNENRQNEDRQENRKNENREQKQEQK
jgi:hypothetical protein